MNINKVRELFYRQYESGFDYSMDVFDRGFTLQRFINDEMPEFKYMFEQEKPEHISELPEGLAAPYLDYLKHELIEEGFFLPNDFVVGESGRSPYEDSCIEEFAEGQCRDQIEQVKLALSNFDEAFSYLIRMIENCEFTELGKRNPFSSDPDSTIYEAHIKALHWMVAVRKELEDEDYE